MNASEKLKELFSRFPGIGPRQAERFVYFLLSQSSAWRSDFSSLLQEMEKEVGQCQRCFRYYQKTDFNQNAEGICSICQNPQRKQDILLIVAHPGDIKHIEAAHTYQGRYFVLGGLKGAASKKEQNSIRIASLLEQLSETEFTEIIIALPATADGDYTAQWLITEITKKLPSYRTRFSLLGRGLSTGTEIEYADPDTLSSALDNRRSLDDRHRIK